MMNYKLSVSVMQDRQLWIREPQIVVTTLGDLHQQILLLWQRLVTPGFLHNNIITIVIEN